jgi:NitT/TauT family transport system substrate-binding protein
VLLMVGWMGCSPAPQTPLVVGTVPWVGTEPFYLARELELYPGPVHLVEYLSSEQAIRAFQNGVIDAAAVTLDEVLNLDRVGQQARVVMVLDVSDGADCVMAQPSVSSLAGLRGRKVAAEDVTLPTYILSRGLQLAGLQLEDVEREPRALEEYDAALRKGEVDAVVAFEPYCHLLEAEGARRIFDSSRIPGEILDVLVVRNQFLEAHPEQVDALMRGWFAALGVLEERPAESARRMGPRVGLSERAFLETLRGVRHLNLPEQQRQLMGDRPRLQETLQRMGAIMVQERILPAPPQSRHLIDTAPLRRVAQ